MTLCCLKKSDNLWRLGGEIIRGPIDIAVRQGQLAADDARVVLVLIHALRMHPDDAEFSGR